MKWFVWVKPICFKQIKQVNDEEQLLQIFRSLYFEKKMQ